MNTSEQKLSLFDFTMIMVSLVIGMGIFRTPINVAQASPNTTVFFAAWLVGGIIALCGALTYAEIGSRLPVTGGYYKIFAYAYHPSIAFSINCVILISNAASLAAVALVGGEYITGILLPLAHDHPNLQILLSSTALQNTRISIAILAILIFYGVNLSGLRVSAHTQNWLTLIKITLILLLIAPLFLYTETPSLPTLLPAPASPLSVYESLKAFGLGLIAVSFTYGGYQQTINFGAEVHNPTQNIPRGIFLGIAIIISLYLTINIAYLHVIGFAALQHSSNIAAIMANKILGPSAEQILSVFLFLGVLAYVNVMLLSNPRVMYAMSQDGILPPIFGQRHLKTDVLQVSLSVFAGLGIIIVFWAQEFDKILNFTIFLDCFGLMLSAATLFILRKRTQHLDDTGIYKMRLYPLMPLLYILAYCFVASSIALDYQNNGNAALVGLSVMLCCMAGYFVLTHFSQQKGV